MHLTVLSRSSALYTTRRIVDAARMAGHRARVIDPLRCEIFLGGDASKLFFRGKPLSLTDACIPRIGQSVQSYGLAILDLLARRGVSLLNGSGAIARSRNKIRCLQHLSAHGIPVPATVMGNDARQIAETLSRVGGCPVLIKLLHGGERTGVMVCETPHSMEAALEALLALGHTVLVQEYVRDVKSRDLRAVVVGGRVVAAVRRVARVGRLSRALRAGARFEAARLRPELAALAEETAKRVGLEVGAVDMLDLRDGPKVFEVNSSPGIQEIESVTGVDVARPGNRGRRRLQPRPRRKCVPRPSLAVRQPSARIRKCRQSTLSTRVACASSL